jgi:hypothetical protein
MSTLIPKFKQTGTGAVNRAINFKLAETVSVKDFGATGDGVTDDAAAIEAASLALYNAGGGYLLIPAGTYLLGTLSSDANSYSSYITARDGVNIIGEGIGVSILKVKSGQNLLYKTLNKPYVIATQQTGLLTNSSMTDFTVDWNGENNLLDNTYTPRNNAAIFTRYGAQNVVVERVEVKTTPGNQCIFIKNETYGTTPGGDVVVRDCIFKDNGSGLVGNYNLDHSSIFIQADNTTIDNNVFTASQTVNGTAFELHGNRGLAQNNKSNYYGNGFYVTSEYNDTTDNTIANNYFTNCQIAFAISAPTYAVNNVKVLNNVFRQQAGISFASLVYFYGGFTVAACDSLTVIGNLFVGNNYANNRFFQVQRQANFIFSNNTVQNFNDATNGYGIFFSGTYVTGTTLANSVQINNNIFTNVLLPIYCSQAIATLKHFSCNGNIFENTTATGVAVVTVVVATVSGIVSSNLYTTTYLAPSLSAGITSVNNIAG